MRYSNLHHLEAYSIRDSYIDFGLARFSFFLARSFLLFICANFSISNVLAQPNINGETGYINMPSGRIEPDGTFRMGYSFAKPYASIWSSIAFLPRLEMDLRYARIMTGDIGAANPYWQGYGDYKDKVVGGKLILIKEGRFIPSLAFGSNDIQGTRLFKAHYLVASKQFGALDVSMGVGNGRIDGFFAGARYTPANWRGIALVTEYDANDYKKDLYSSLTGVDKRKKGAAIALEYRYGWLGSQISYRDGKAGINLYASIPFGAREFIPKLKEPPPDTDIVVRPTIDQWNAEPKYRQNLIDRLIDQDFKNVEVDIQENTVKATLTNSRISLPSRSVGRAARSIILNSPRNVQEIKINFAVNDMPFATYTFTDTSKLKDYFNGLESRKQLATTVKIDYAEPGESSRNSGTQTDYVNSHLDNNEGDLVSFRSESARLDKFRVAPGLGFYFNDPSGALRYETFVNASAVKQLSDGLFFNASTQLTLWQDVSGVRQTSNSLLPHVRTDVADYKKNGNFKLNQSVLNKYYHPHQRIYVRSSAGLYEEMFGGAGGQILYYPASGPWAFDFNVDALRQRNTSGWFSFRKYSTVTALVTLHYRFRSTGVTAAIRAGKFLAKDNGARFELKRRFRSGFEVGAWYTRTNGNDITGPGTPSHPYYDKGVFMSIPLSSMLTRDTQATPRISISPWTRDVGQMVTSPGDLYDMLEPAYINMHDRDGLQYFGDLDDSYD